MMLTTIGDLYYEQEERNKQRDKENAIPFISTGKILSRYTQDSKSGDGSSIVEYPVLGSPDIKNGIVSLDNLKTKPVNINRLSIDHGVGPFLKEGEIVISLSSPFSSAYINKETEEKNVIVTNSFAVIRPDDEIKEKLDPKFLAAYLSTPYTKETIIPAVVPENGYFRSLNLRNGLFYVPVPLPDMDVQKDLSQMAFAHLKAVHKREAKEKIEEQIFNAIFYRIITSTDSEQPDIDKKNDEENDTNEQ